MQPPLYFLGKTKRQKDASYTYKGLSEAHLNIGINCEKILKEVGSMLPLSGIALPNTVALSCVVKQALLSTRANMWQLIFIPPSEMDLKVYKTTAGLRRHYKAYICSCHLVHPTYVPPKHLGQPPIYMSKTATVIS